jgi:hypothetical protein
MTESPKPDCPQCSCTSADQEEGRTDSHSFWDFD